VDHLQGQAPLGHHPGGYWRVDAAGEQAHRTAVDAHGEAARAGFRIRVDIGGILPYLQMDGELGVVDVHLQIGI